MRRRPKCRYDSRGFTLLEILVVVFIIAIMTGMMAIQFVRDDSDTLRAEGDRIALLLQAARDEAVLQGSLLVFELQPNSYRFLEVRKNKFEPIQDGPFARTTLPRGVRAQLIVDGQQPEKDKRQVLVIDGSGALPSFEVALSLNDERWSVTGQGPDIRSGNTDGDK